jgi:hypothetical protein
MIRAGFTDDALDAATRQLLLEAEGVRAADAGVEAVLALSLEVGALYGWLLRVGDLPAGC